LGFGLVWFGLVAFGSAFAWLAYTAGVSRRSFWLKSLPNKILLVKDILAHFIGCPFYLLPILLVAHFIGCPFYWLPILLVMCMTIKFYCALVE